MTALIDTLLQHFGYYAIFVLIFGESIGIPLPGETALIAGAVYAGTTHHLDITTIVAIAATAAVAGDNVGYLLGRRFGPQLITRLGKRFRLAPSYLAVCAGLFERHGAKVVFFGRFIGLLRTWAAFLAGVNRLPWRGFVAANLAGGVVWAAAWSAAGYYLGAGAGRIGHWATIAGLTATAIITLVGARLARSKFRALEAQAEGESDAPAASRASI